MQRIPGIIYLIGAATLLPLAGCTNLASSSSTSSWNTPVTVAELGNVVFTTGGIDDRWSGPYPLTVQQHTSSGSWVNVLSFDGQLSQLESLPNGDYRIWDYDTLLGHFSITRD